MIAGDDAISDTDAAISDAISDANSDAAISDAISDAAISDAISDAASDSLDDATISDSDSPTMSSDTNGSVVDLGIEASVEMVTLEEEQGTCRICLDQVHISDLIEACHCTGSRRWVHRACIDRWRSQFSRWHVQRHRCQVCRRDYRHPVEGFRIVVHDDLSDSDEEPAIVRRRRMDQRRRQLRRRQRSQALVVAITGSGVLFVFSTLAVVVVMSFPRGLLDNYLWVGSAIQGTLSVMTASMYFHVTTAMEKFDVMHVCILIMWVGSILLFANYVFSFFMMYATMVMYSAAICGMACKEWDGCT